MAGDPSTRRRAKALDLRSWAIPRPVLAISAVLAAALLIPLVAVFLLAGAGAALALAMGYVACLPPALSLRARYAWGLIAVAAMTGVVATALARDPLAAACFVALTCLTVAPAEIVQPKLAVGIPTAAAVFVALPVAVESVTVGWWMLAGGAISVAVGARVPRRPPAAGVDAATAWRHAVVMAILVGAVVYQVEILQIPHGYWIAMTLTVVLRPFGPETQQAAWQRVTGTVAGALMALVLVFLLPQWAVLVAVVISFVLMIASAVQGSLTRQVAFMTPAVILLGSSAAPFDIAAERVLATLVGALLAIGAALALAATEHRRADAAEVGSGTVTP